MPSGNGVCHDATRGYRKVYLYPTGDQGLFE